MLKRQRPATPPPSSLDDPPLFLHDGPSRPLQSSDPTQPHSKRRRTLPPPLDGMIRGWPNGSHWESDGEEDWIEDAHGVPSPPLSAPTTGDHYKNANNLLHELHVLNQHRLLFAHPPPPRECRLDPPTGVSPLAAHTLARPAVTEQGPPYQAFPRVPLDDRLGDDREEKGLVREVQHVRQRYEDANRFLGSLFLSRRRIVEETAS